MILASFVLMALLLSAGYFLLSVIVHFTYRAPRRVETGSPADLGLAYHAVTIPTANARRLFGWYVPLPNPSERAPAVVIIHGWGGNSEFMLPFARLLHRAGYAALLVDARNHGRSDSDSFSSMPRFAEDLEHGLGWLAARPEIDPRRIALMGHSVGASAALLVASRREEVAAVVSIAAFAHPGGLLRRQMTLHHIHYLPFGWAVMRYIEHAIGVRFEAIAPVNTIRKVSCPVLLIHGCEDRYIPLSDAEAIHAQRGHEGVVLLTLSGAGHDSVEYIDSHGKEVVRFLGNALAERTGV